MITAFMEIDSTGSTEMRRVHDYDEGNLKEGIAFAQWELELGKTVDWLDGWDLNRFVVWAEEELKLIADERKAMAERAQHGVECPVCNQECFRTFEREATVRVKVCGSCARRIDAEAEKKIVKDALAGVESKAERHQRLKEMSWAWADGMHGKQVIVRYDVQDGYKKVHGYLEPATKSREIRGMAFSRGVLKEGWKGWGEVKVVIDKSELHRIVYVDATYWDWSHADGRREVKYQRPTIDGIEYDPVLVSHGSDYKIEKPLCFYVSWGSRFEYEIVAIERKEENDGVAVESGCAEAVGGQAG